MPFALIIIGVVLILVGYQGTQSQLFTLLKGDFTGSGNFVYWVVSILIIGWIGYIPKMKGLSQAFLALVLIVLFVSHAGFFASFNSQLKSGTTAAPAAGGVT